MKYQEWRDILQKVNKTEDDLLVMESDSLLWSTCAVGAKFMCDLQKEGLLPNNVELDSTVISVMRMENHIVNDHIFTLGHDQFLSAIFNKRWDDALSILDEIYNTENIYADKDSKKQLLPYITSNNW